MTLERTTTFSPDRLHRYTLWREWEDLFVEHPDGFVNFICLNPSTATETLNDPTMRKCIKFTRSFGYRAMCVTNIFAWRATDPEDMKIVPGDGAIGSDNDSWITRVAGEAGLVIAAWSQHAGHNGRSAQVRRLLRELGKPVHYLRMGTGGEPYHPLYLPDSTKPELWVTI